VIQSLQERSQVPGFVARWSALATIAIAMYGCYYAFDCTGPLAPVLTRQLHFSDYQIGLLQASYSIPNVFVLLIAGVVIDRVGARISMLGFSVIIFAGLLITCSSAHIAVMACGRLFVGLGSEALAMASHVAIARWFAQSELGLAFALRSSGCRLGSLSAQTSPTWAAPLYRYWRWPLLLSVALGSLCVLGTGLFWLLDRRSEKLFAQEDRHRAKLTFKGLLRFNRSFWLLAAICITFYSCTFPFQTFGQKFLINTHHVTPRDASLLVGMEPLCSLLLMPVFGYLVDRYGQRALAMTIGSVILTPVFLLLGYTKVSPLGCMAMLGLAFALVPAVLWTSIVFVVDRTRLGFASAVVDAVQQFGLVGANLLIGWSNDTHFASAVNPAGYHPSMWIFTGFAVLSVLFAGTLRSLEMGDSSHGLEKIRIDHPL